jgi:hypothetical protein
MPPAPIRIEWLLSRMRMDDPRNFGTLTVRPASARSSSMVPSVTYWRSSSGDSSVFSEVTKTVVPCSFR